MARRSTGHVILHTSLIIICIGAIITGFCSKQGYMQLSQHSNSNFYTDSKTGEMFYTDFVVFADSINAAMHQVSIHTTYNGNEKHNTIALNKIARINGFRFSINSIEDGHTVLYVIYDPVGTNIVFIGYGLFIASIIAFLLDKRSRIRTRIHIFKPPFNSRIIVYCLIALALILLSVLIPVFREKSQIPILNTHWLHIHVYCVMTAYSLLASICILSVIWLIRKRDWTESLCRIILHAGVYALALGIITGSWWANVSWGGYWSWDPKETWALITMIGYSLPFHFPKAFSSKKRFSWFLVLALGFVLMTWFGVNHWMPGLHSYA
ncbi:MAG: cytochrome c biogenesis protein CcsA [Bacteroidaceae bacterium]|nr:cytochrome c biogenesis protein CcsA [Bacteroidaceae bacterium]